MTSFSTQPSQRSSRQPPKLTSKAHMGSGLKSSVPRPLVPSPFFLFIFAFIIIFFFVVVLTSSSLSSLFFFSSLATTSLLDQGTFHPQKASSTASSPLVFLSLLAPPSPTCSSTPERAGGDEGLVTTNPGRASVLASHCHPLKKTPGISQQAWFLPHRGLPQLGRHSGAFGLVCLRVLLPRIRTSTSLALLSPSSRVCSSGTDSKKPPEGDEETSPGQVKGSDQYTTSKNSILEMSGAQRGHLLRVRRYGRC
ncbi:hypothetical protein SMACR_12745 [Sordaria macrospora]|uniref:WGS project CABT00000000 data, contig 2.22 n=2 Tax=Sordaria macrospora TaxID=5147 RepID=F7W2M7_SORMK|nr:uncharacterized protein SMAC_12745 [Sordaria macrospora k-hell]KAA8633517.1 hypothetical protein SMACR_12745 [Sordaria macrospora]KAH7632534.1 hypothetical protein B0T09DRAFT_354652 [Sordaria sp. MPI-SDFR-AT-0083]WPJ60979.1 hypothetical protein SMAC4_12745 [Sordaria macrospora]CCC11878.1 unnamed protein product [Sordaria macrospora k-hell]